MSNSPDYVSTGLVGLAARENQQAFVKYDQQKPDLSLLPPRAIQAVGRVLTYGARKYSPDNWRNVAKTERKRYIAAALRHIFQEMESPGTPDTETGESHLAHALCCLLFLLELQLEERTDNATKTG